MKTFALTVSAVTLLAGSAFAQDSRPSPRPSATQPARDPMQGNVPAVQQGSGQTSGGPARELIPNR